MKDIILYQPCNIKKVSLTLALAPKDSGLVPGDEVMIAIQKKEQTQTLRAKVVEILTGVDLKPSVTHFVFTYGGFSDVLDIPNVVEKVIYTPLSDR